MSLKPLHNYVVAKLLDSQAKTAGGLFIPSTAKSSKNRALIVSVFEPFQNQVGVDISSKLKPGDTVIISADHAIEVEENGEKLLLINEAEVLAIVSERTQEFIL
jgi:chaperonin GroES